MSQKMEYSSEIKELAYKISDKFDDRKCQTMGSALRQHLDDPNRADDEITKLLSSEMFQHVRRNTKDTETVQEMVDMVNFIMETPTSGAVGEELVRRLDFNNNATRQIPIVDPAIARKTARARNNKGRGGRRRYIKVYPELELEDHESWDSNFLEDADWNVASEESRLISEALDRKTSAEIIAFIKAIPANTLNGGRVYPGPLNFDSFIDMKANMKERFVTPKVCVMGVRTAATLMKTDEFKDSRQYGDFTNKAEGYIGHVNGMDIFETDELDATDCWMLDTMYAVLFGVRRYKMMESYAKFSDTERKMKYGIQISTRYDLKVGLPVYISRMDAA